jgi:hypothetical protein
MMSFLDDLKDKMRENEAVMNLAEKFPPLASFLGNQPSEGGQSNPDATGEFDQESMKKQMMEEQTTIADGEDLEEGEVAEKPKQKLKPIHIAAIIAILWMAFDTEEEQPQVQPKQKVAKAKKAMPVKKKPVLKVPPAEMPNVDNVPDKPVVKVDPIETIRKQVPKKEPVKVEEVVVDSNQEVELSRDFKEELKKEEAPSFEQDKDKRVVDLMGVDPTVPKEEEPLPEQEAANFGQDAPSANEMGGADFAGEQEVMAGVGQSMDESAGTEKVLLELQKQLQKNEEKKEKRLVYATPNYNRFGRGLVYSCKGKHWACIDGENYGKCEMNYNFNKKAQKPSECVPKEVYISNEHCDRAQQIKVDAIEQTNFCY